MNLEAIKQQTMKHIFMYSIPSIIAMLLSSFVTIVDGFFIAKVVGKDALAAMNLGIPMLYVFLAIGIMIGVGGVSLAGRRLGAKDIDSSVNVFNQTIITGIIIFIVLILMFFIGLKPVISHINLEITTQNTMISYYGVMLWVYPIMMMNIIFGMFIRCEGKPHVFMINTIVTTVINVLLDYIFIVRLDLGIRGAACASGIAVIAGTLLMIKYFKGSKALFNLKKFEFSHMDLKQTLANGSSELIGQLSLSITTLFLNIVLMKKMGLLGVAAMTLIGYTRYIYNMIVIGFGQGVSPMLSFSYGAKEYNIGIRLRQYTQGIVFILGILFYVILNLGSTTYAKIFTTDTELVSIVIGGLKLFSLAFLVTGFNVIASFYFTAIGYAKQSAILSSLRGLILLSLNIFLLPIFFGNTGIWMVAPVTEILTFFVGIYFIQQLNCSLGDHTPSIPVDKRTIQK